MPVTPSLHRFRAPTLTAIIEEALSFFDNTPIHPLPPHPFFGVGVYAIYYSGPFPEYQRLAALNRERGAALPIYAGKAVPEGWRQGRAKTASAQSEKLYSRLNEHARSIREGEGLNLSDFHCRFVILSDIESDLISTVESALIRKYSPLWNSYVDGFGNHDPGSGRYDQSISEWDVLHPGRAFAERLRGTAPSRAAIVDKVRRYFSQRS